MNNLICILLFVFLAPFSLVFGQEVNLENIDLEKIHEEVIKEMPLSSERWKINGEYLSIVRDPIEHISINEDCHPLEEKKCELDRALKKYLSMEVTPEIKTLFVENKETRPGKIVCTQLLNGMVITGEKPIRGRFPKFEEFCQFSDGSLITIASLGFYQGPEKIRLARENSSDTESSQADDRPMEN